MELILFLYLMWLDASNTKTVKCTSQVMQYRITVGEVEIIATVQIGVVENRGSDLPKRREQILAELWKKFFCWKRSLIYYFFNVAFMLIFPTSQLLFH